MRAAISMRGPARFPPSPAASVEAGQLDLSKSASSGLRNEARPRRVDVAIALRALAVDEETLRHNEVQIVLGARHRDIEQPALFLDFRRRAGAEIGRHAAVDHVQHDTPTSTPGPWRNGSSTGSDSPRRAAAAGLVAGGVRRIERQFGQEALARGIAARDLLELDQIGAAQSRHPRGCARDAARTRAARVRFRPASSELAKVRRPSRRRRLQSSPARGGAGSIGQRRQADRRLRPCDRARAAPWPARRPGSSCSDAEARHAVARVLGQAQQRQHVLDVRGIEEFQAAELDERECCAASARSPAARCGCERPEQHGLLLQQRAAARDSPAPARRCSAPGRPRRAR